MFRIRRLALACALSTSTLLFALAGTPIASAQEVAAPAPAADAASAEPAIPNSKCLACHDDAEMKNEAGESVAVHEEQFAASAHKRVDCVECHTAALTVKHKGKRQPLGPVGFDVCMECHEDEITPFQNSVHARVKGDKPVTCEGCHGNIHTVVRSNNPAALMSPLNQIKTCGKCHDDDIDGFMSPASMARAAQVGPDGVGAVLQRLPRQPRHPAPHGCHARERRTRRARTCAASCHEGVLKEWSESTHGALWRDGKDGPRVLHLPSRRTRSSRRTAARTCSRCRTSAAAVTRTCPRPSTTASTARPRRSATRSAAMCSDCHTPHHNLSASRPAVEHSTPTTWPRPAAEQLPRRRGQRVVPDVHPAQRPDGPGPEPMGPLHLPVHVAAAARRVRVLRPAHAAVAAAHPGRPAARRVQGPALRRPARTSAASRTTQMWLHVADHPELPAAVDHRPAAQVRGGAVGAAA